MRFSRKSLALPLVLALSACSSDPVDIGDDRVVRTGEKLSDYAAEWIGYTEGHEFWAGSDRVRITLDENGEGTLEVGDSPPIPPATNPDVGYPDTEPKNSPEDLISPAVMLLSGFSYTVNEATVEERRLRLEIDLYELYTDWCEMQTPYPVESTYGCLPGTSGGFDAGRCYKDDPETGEPFYADCAKIGMCAPGRICSCTAEACTAVAEPSRVLDAALEDGGDGLEGTFTVPLGSPEHVTVRMTRQ
jgi:hypothetical protein